MKLIDDDPWLVPVADKIEARYKAYFQKKQYIDQQYGSLYDFANLHNILGFHYDVEKHGWHFRDWLPRAKEVYITTSLSDWEPCRYPLKPTENGIWHVFLPFSETEMHNAQVLLNVKGADGWSVHIPSCIRYATQNEETKAFVGRVWWPEKAFDWQGDVTLNIAAEQLLIYECHVGMAQQFEGIGTYRQFEQNIIPFVKRLGYNALQIMALAEHPYYASYGYQVSNFFAPSSRFGTPDELKHLIRTAHKTGLAVIMDVVHAHFVSNTLEGLNMLDGEDDLYSPQGDRGNHPYWNTKLFDYDKEQVLRFLLSNLRYWIEEFHIDGFRFDGVTSMIYHHHGYVDNFGTHSNYFGQQVNESAITYLTLANDLVHAINPKAVTIAEEVSGMPGIARPIDEGGVGFDYRMAMALPDYWIKLLKDKRDEEWSMYELWNVANDRIWNVKTVAYCESHDQAIVGDKTIAFRLMDSMMYTSMQKDFHNVQVDRGIALHKMIRLFTILVGGQAYLNFMGNEFGHPEWVDFPRDGNNWSFAYARRLWYLADDKTLKYSLLLEFDRAMVAFAKQHKVMKMEFANLLLCDEENKTLVFARDKWVAVFNWHTIVSIAGYTIPVKLPGRYKLVLSTDSEKYGGFGRLNETTIYQSRTNKKKHHIEIYNINRSANLYEIIN